MNKRGAALLHHVTTIGGTKSSNTGLIDVRMGLKDVVESLHQVNIRRAAPVLVDSISQLLAITSRSSGVQEDNNKAGASKDVGVPAGAPVVVKGALGSSMDNEGEGVLLRGVESNGLEEESVNVSALISREPDILGLGEVDISKSVGMNVGEALGDLGLDIDGEEVVGGGQGGGRVEDGVVVDQVQSALGVLADDGLDCLSLEVDLKDLDVALVLSSDKDSLILGVKENACRAAVPVLGDNAGLSVGVDDDSVAVSLVLGLEHLEVGNGLSGGRVDGVTGSADALGVDGLWCGTSGGGDGVDVGGCLPGIVRGVDLGNKDDLLAVRGDVKVALIAKGNHGGLEAGVEQEVDGLAIDNKLVAILLDMGDKDVVLLLLDELVPMADHEGVKGECGVLLVVLEVLIPLLGSSKRPVGIDGSAEGDQVGSLVELNAVDIDGEVGEGVGLGIGGDGLDKELAIGKEGDVVVVEPEGIVMVVVGCLGGKVREGVVVGEVDEVEVADGLVGVDIIARGGEDGELTVGRQRSGRGTGKGEHELGGQGLESGGCGGDHGDDGGGGEDESHDGKEARRAFYTFCLFLVSCFLGWLRRVRRLKKERIKKEAWERQQRRIKKILSIENKRLMGTHSRI